MGIFLMTGETSKQDEENLEGDPDLTITISGNKVVLREEVEEGGGEIIKFLKWLFDRAGRKEVDIGIENPDTSVEVYLSEKGVLTTDWYPQADILMVDELGPYQREALRNLLKGPLTITILKRR